MSQKRYSRGSGSGWDPITRMTIRPCTSADLESVTELVIQAGLSADGLEDQFDDGYAVAELSGRMIGCAGVEIHGAYGLLRSVAVLPGRQGKGIGARLVKNRLDWARSQRISAVYLLTETAAIFFSRLGFEKTDRRGAPAQIQATREYTVMCPNSADLMMLRL